MLTNTQKILLAGAIGGASPSLLTLALTWTRQSKATEDISLVPYLVGTLILALIGAAVVWAFGEKNRQKAVTLGISLPALLNVGVTSISDNKAPAKESSNSSAWIGLPLIPGAYAQAPEPSPTLPVSTPLTAPIPSRTLDISTGTSDQNYTVILQDVQGQASRTTVQGQKFHSLVVPEDTASVQFEAGGVATQKFVLSSVPGTATAFDLNISTKRKVGFFQAFGAKAAVESSIFATQKVITPPPPGTEGWVYLGKRAANGGWQTLYAKLPTQDIPQANTATSVSFPLRLRSAAGSGNDELGILPVGHRFTILETKTTDQVTYWAKIRTGP